MLWFFALILLYMYKICRRKKKRLKRLMQATVLSLKLWITFNENVLTTRYIELSEISHFMCLWNTNQKWTMQKTSEVTRFLTQTEKKHVWLHLIKDFFFDINYYFPSSILDILQNLGLRNILYFIFLALAPILFFLNNQLFFFFFFHPFYSFQFSFFIFFPFLTLLHLSFIIEPFSFFSYFLCFFL